jgi:ParB-like chromosome segregation protein Spo0J
MPVGGPTYEPRDAADAERLEALYAELTVEEHAEERAEERAQALAALDHADDDNAARVVLASTLAVARESPRRSRERRTHASSTSPSTGDGDDDGGDGGDEPPRRTNAVPRRGAVRTVPTGSLRLHPLATIVPESSTKEFEALKADIERDGLNSPLHVVGNIVLDGRHRLRAALELGLKAVPVVDVELSEESPESFILRTALHRRHLSDDQRAVMAARWVLTGGAL